MNMTLTNNEIYNYANALGQEFGEDKVTLPLKVNFYLQKNIAELMTLAQDIEKQRVAIAEKYGTLDEEGQQYQIPTEKIDDAARELEELFSLTQDVKIYKVKLDAFGDTNLTSGQMQAMLFMIDDEEDSED